MPGVSNRDERGLGVLKLNRIACYLTALYIAGDRPDQYPKLIIRYGGFFVQPMESMEDFGETLGRNSELGIRESEHLVKQVCSFFALVSLNECASV